MSSVLVTGASGFIGKHVVRELLEREFMVRAAVRSDRSEAQVRALFDTPSVSICRLDLTRDDGWVEAMEGVDALMHVASPFPADEPKDPQEIIRPAVDGTLRALSAARAVGVNRVVLTSSCVAIYKDALHPRDQVSTRENWTDPNAKTTSAYEASKTLAERAAWDFVAANPGMQLTSINPGAVFGVPMDEHYGTSLAYVERIMSGADPAYPNVVMPVVDVRDVALMHVRALELDETIGHRFPATCGALSLGRMGEILSEEFPGRKFTTRTIPDPIAKLAARLLPSLRPIAGSVGRNLAVDGTDAPRVMKFEYVPPRETLLASARYLAARERGGGGDAS